MYNIILVLLMKQYVCLL